MLGRRNYLFAGSDNGGRAAANIYSLIGTAMLNGVEPFAYPLMWFKTQHVPVVAERIQVDTYIACQVLSEAVGHSFGDLVPDYLIEQIENMVSLKLIDGYYPRLGLAPGQRFASKGGYVVKLAPVAGGTVIADTGWVVP